MRTLKTKILFIALFLFCEGFFSPGKAQTFTARAASNTVAVGQEFQVDYTLNGSGGSFTPPPFTGFNVMGSGMESSSGTGSSGSQTFSFFLAAKSEGTFTIAPASILFNGKTITSNSLTIKAVKGTPPQNTAPPPAARQGNSSAPSSSAVDKKYLFTKLVPGKTKVYVGEEVTVTLKVYYRIKCDGGELVEAPDYDAGFYTEDLPQSPREQSTTKESVDGLSYSVDSYPQKILFPQHTGKLKIGACTTKFVVEQQVKVSMGFGMYMYTQEEVPCITKTEPFTIDVMPLPKTEKKFSGAVGELSITGKLDKNKVNANDAVNLTITVSGNGNLNLIDTLPIQFPPDFDHYDPKIADHFTINASGVSGTRTFNYLLIPRQPGSFKIPAAGFTYFNTKKKEYVTLSTPEMNLDVAKGENNSSAVTVSGPVNKEDVKVIGSDIRYIHGGHETFYRTDDFFLYSAPFFGGIFTPLLAFIGFVVARRRYVEAHKDTVALKKRGATRMAKKRLKIAHQNIASGNKEVFYAELLSALNGYFSDKFSIPTADLSRVTISANLTQKNVQPETLQMVNKALDDCEFARYAPATVTGNLEEVYSSAVKLITLLEDEIS